MVTYATRPLLNGAINPHPNNIQHGNVYVTRKFTKAVSMVPKRSNVWWRCYVRKSLLLCACVLSVPIKMGSPTALGCGGGWFSLIGLGHQVHGGTLEFAQD